jgi:hypothetical protein
MHAIAPTVYNGTRSASARFMLSCIASVLMATNTAYAQNEKANAVNDQFHKMYAQARQEAAQSAEPILIVRRDSLTLWRQGQTIVEHYLPEQSDALKVADHVGLAIFAALVHDPDHPSAERLHELSTLRAAALAARSGLEPSALTAECKARQDKLIDTSVAFIDSVLKNKGCGAQELRDYVRTLLPLTDANIKDSAALELGALHEAVRHMRDKMSAQEWASMHVVISVSHMARAQDMRFQYFQRLLDQPAEGDRVVVYEGNADDNELVKTVGTHMLDAQIGEAYFGDAWRMHRDLLSAAASQYLDEHPVK